MDLLALASLAAHLPPLAAQAEEGGTGVVINLFWVVAFAANLVIFFVAAWYLGLRNLPANLAVRRARIEQGLKDADLARQEREKASAERLAAITEARKEAEEILSRAQRVADENRERDMAETRAQLEQLRTQAAADIASEKERAMDDVRSQVAELALAAASRVVGETLTSEREKRLVNEFLTEVGRT
jgi:F-type H+-transporting ATPase subunit b